MADESGQAFPQYARLGEVEQAEGGLTKREWFAGQALVGILAAKNFGMVFGSNAQVAIATFEMADLMIAASRKNQ